MSWGATNNLAVACVAVASAAGCHSAPAPADKQARQDLRDAWARRTPGDLQHPTSVTVAQGRSPVVYQVQEPVVVHITDTTAGKEIATASAARGSLVYVSEDTGAFANGRRLVAGPFVAGHDYAISVDVEQDQPWTSQRNVATRPTLLPATRPRQQQDQ